MMLKKFVTLSLAGAICATATDFGGRWAGVFEEGDRAVPIYLTLSQLGLDVSGTLTPARGGQSTPVQHAEAVGDRLKFAVRNDRGELLNLELKLSVEGNPVFEDRQVVLDGTAKTAYRSFDVLLYPTREDPGYIEGGITTGPIAMKTNPAPTGAPQERIRTPQERVRLRVEIEPTGMVGDHITVVHSLETAADERAIESVKQWRFKPGFRNGYAVKTPATVEVNVSR